MSCTLQYKMHSLAWRFKKLIDMQHVKVYVKLHIIEHVWKTEDNANETRSPGFENKQRSPCWVSPSLCIKAIWLQNVIHILALSSLGSLSILYFSFNEKSLYLRASFFLLICGYVNIIIKRHCEYKTKLIKPNDYTI